jgi:hypothetical protein
MTQYVLRPNDIPTLMDCMTECFAETDKVNAKMLASKMTQKLGRVYSYQTVSYIYTFLGFVGCPDNSSSRFLVRNDELVAKIKADCQRIKETAEIGREINMSASPYSKRTNKDSWNYFTCSRRG